jgi:hypothetical protein
LARCQRFRLRSDSRRAGVPRADRSDPGHVRTRGQVSAKVDSTPNASQNPRRVEVAAVARNAGSGVR